MVYWATNRHEGGGLLARDQQHELTPQAVERITAVVRSLADDQVDRGIDLGRPMACDSCGEEKSPRGASVYGSYKLCNDCLLDFTLRLARGEVNNVAEFMTKRAEGTPPVMVAGDRDRANVQFSAFQARDTLRPSNEPC